MRRTHKNLRGTRDRRKHLTAMGHGDRKTGVALRAKEFVKSTDPSHQRRYKLRLAIASSVMVQRWISFSSPPVDQFLRERTRHDISISCYTIFHFVFTLRQQLEQLSCHVATRCSIFRSFYHEDVPDESCVSILRVAITSFKGMHERYGSASPPFFHL